jgi:thioester reductase-like protein
MPDSRLSALDVSPLDVQSPSGGGVLLTGATGFVGMELLSRLLERSKRPVYALVRAADAAEARVRLRGVLATLYGTGDPLPDRLVPVPGDIEVPRLGLQPGDRDALADRVEDIVHGAASVSFDLPLETARRVNVEGTKQLLEFAELCHHRGGLRRFSYISTAFVAGTHAGEFHEDQLEVGQSFRNSYEQSKFEAERLVRSWGDRVPVQVIRPSIVVGERDSGWTASFNVLYGPLKAFARGHLPLIPARREAPVDVVPVDYVADAVFELVNRPAGQGGTYQLVAGEGATTVGHLVDLSASLLGRRRPLLVPPPLYRRLLHPLLLRRSAGRRRQALERMETFFPYFATGVRYRNERARRRLEASAISPPPVERYFQRLLDFALTARWGRTEIGRAQARARVHGSRPAGQH